MASARITPELTTVLDDLMREATPSPERTITALLAALAVT